MAAYALKRVLLMLPTFFAIALVVFVVLNFAPGDPAAEHMGAGGEGHNVELAGQQHESYRLFKEQFNLDKPILLNTRFALSAERVAQVLRTTADEGAAPGVRLRAREDLDDWGSYAVPGLIAALDDPSLAALASQRLAVDAQRPMRGRYREDRLSDTERVENTARAAENDTIRRWAFPSGAPAEVVVARSARWRSWYDTNRARWTWSPSDKLGILLLDTRFARYVGNLLRLDFGISHVDKRPVMEKIRGKLKYSITLALSSVLLVYLVAVPLGIWSAANQHALRDRLVTLLLFVLYSLPTFFVGVVLLNALTRGTPWQVLPTAGFESLDTGHMTTLDYLRDVAWHVLLPITCLSYGSLAQLSRYSRSGLLEVIRADYIRTARAKGLAEPVVLIKHAARNGLIPVLTLMATMLPALIGGSVVVEVVFGIPGMGLFMFESINVRDYNSVMAVLLVAAVLTQVGMLLSDLSYALVDPRITFEARP